MAANVRQAGWVYPEALVAAGTAATPSVTMSQTNPPSRVNEPSAGPCPAPATGQKLENELVTSPAQSPTKIEPVRQPIPEPGGNLRRRDEAFKRRRGGPPA